MCSRQQTLAPGCPTVEIPPSLQNFLLDWPAQIIIRTTVLMMLMAVGWHLVSRFRDRSDDDRLTASELLTNFQELHHQGDIDEKEYRTIKMALGAQLQEELKDTDSTG